MEGIMWQAMNEVVATVGIGIRERLLGLCDAMETRLHGLRDSKRRVSEDVHEARKLGKSLRGGLVLVGMPAETLLAVQAVGRLLAGQRDAVSRRKTWGCLGWEDSPHAHDPAVRAVEALLGKLARAAGRRPPDETVVWAQARIGEVRRALARSCEEGLQKELPNGVRRLRRRVCKRLKFLGMKECDKPAFHEARKALKAWLGAQFLLGEPPDPGLVLLAELLGDENDLSVLEDWLESRGFCKNMAPVVWRIVSDRHHKLRVRVIEERDSAKIC